MTINQFSCKITQSNIATNMITSLSGYAFLGSVSATCIDE